MIPTKKLAAAVLERSDAVEAYQEKLARIVVDHHESLARLLNALPNVKADALAALVPDLTSRLDSTIPQMVREQAEAIRSELTTEQLETATKLAEHAQATRDTLRAMIDEGMAAVVAERQRVVETHEIIGRLEGIAEAKAGEVAKAELAAPAVKALMQEVIDAQPPVALPAPQIISNPGDGFAGLFKGEYTKGTKAKRGEIWAWAGGTYLCIKDTRSEPWRNGKSWALLAAPGRDGMNGSGGGGSSLPDQTGNSGKFLTTDGSNPSWATLAGGGDLLAANNLSDVANAASAFGNIKQAATEAASGVVELATSAETTAGLAVQASDTRLSDARTPTAHKTSHENGGADEISVAGLSGVLADPQPPIIGAGATQAVAGNDARLTDERVPTAAGLTSKFGTNKASFADGDKIAILDSAAADAPKHGLWSLVKSTLKTYFDTLYQAADADLTTWAGITPGTGVATALAVNVGSAGAPVVLNGAGGTPSSLTLTNATGLPASGIAAGVLGGDITLGESTGQIVLDTALSADGKWSGICEAGTAGAALAFGDLCYFAVADSRWELTDADAAATAGPVKIGICVLAAAGDGSATVMLLWGKVRADAVFPTMTIGAPLYVGLTAGDIAVTETWGTDDVIRIIGHANTADELFFHPSNDYITYV